MGVNLTYVLCCREADDGDDERALRRAGEKRGKRDGKEQHKRIRVVVDKKGLDAGAGDGVPHAAETVKGAAGEERAVPRKVERGDGVRVRAKRAETARGAHVPELDGLVVRAARDDVAARAVRAAAHVALVPAERAQHLSRRAVKHAHGLVVARRAQVPSVRRPRGVRETLQVSRQRQHMRGLFHPPQHRALVRRCCPSLTTAAATCVSVREWENKQAVARKRPSGLNLVALTVALWPCSVASSVNDIPRRTAAKVRFAEHLLLSLLSSLFFNVQGTTIGFFFPVSFTLFELS